MSLPCMMPNDPSRGMVTNTRGLVTSFLGLVEITPDELKILDRFVEPHFNEDGLISRLAKGNQISFISLCMPENSTNILAFCSFKEEKDCILLENLCTSESGGMTAKAFIFDSITYITRVRQKEILLFVDSTNKKFNILCESFRNLMITGNSGHRLPLLYECKKNVKKQSYWMKKVTAGTNFKWKDFPTTFTIAFTTVPQPDSESESEESESESESEESEPS